MSGRVCGVGGSYVYISIVVCGLMHGMCLCVRVYSFTLLLMYCAGLETWRGSCRHRPTPRGRSPSKSLTQYQVLLLPTCRVF